ncbi:hypothetical protein BC834DRAFT_562552 [Gloeopeniophorella convolvens]|nr:hypothetical protein BC834DRAFT_562552 [Gloeopeniophorella convolvens]
MAPDHRARMPGLPVHTSRHLPRTARPPSPVDKVHPIFCTTLTDNNPDFPFPAYRSSHHLARPHPPPPPITSTRVSGPVPQVQRRLPRHAVSTAGRR